MTRYANERWFTEFSKHRDYHGYSSLRGYEVKNLNSQDTIIDINSVCSEFNKNTANSRHMLKTEIEKGMHQIKMKIQEWTFKYAKLTIDLSQSQKHLQSYKDIHKSIQEIEILIKRGYKIVQEEFRTNQCTLDETKMWAKVYCRLAERVKVLSESLEKAGKIRKNVLIQGRQEYMVYLYENHPAQADVYTQSSASLIQQQQQMNVAGTSSLLSQKQREMLYLENEVEELMIMMREIAGMVKGQQELTRQIISNIDGAEQHIQSGVSEIERIREETMNLVTSRMIILFAMSLSFALILIYGMFFKHRVK